MEIDKKTEREIKQEAKLHIRQRYKAVAPAFKHNQIQELSDFAIKILAKYGGR